MCCTSDDKLFCVCSMLVVRVVYLFVAWCVFVFLCFCMSCVCGVCVCSRVLYVGLVIAADVRSMSECMLWI